VAKTKENLPSKECEQWKR